MQARVLSGFVIRNIILGWVIFRSSGKLLNPSNFCSSAHVLIAQQTFRSVFKSVAESCSRCYVSQSLCTEWHLEAWGHGRVCTCELLRGWVRLTPAPCHDWQSLATGAGAWTENWGRSQCQVCPPPPSLALPSKGCHRSVLDLAHPDVFFTNFQMIFAQNLTIPLTDTANFLWPQPPTSYWSYNQYTLLITETA